MPSSPRGLSRGDPPHPAPPRLRSPRGSIADVLPCAAALLGVSGAADTLDLVGSVGDVRRVAIVLVDGMGRHLIAQLAGDAPLLASVLTGRAGRFDELACTFPSTTPASLAPLTTGATPGEHGILGFTVKVPGSEQVLNHIRWRGDPPAAQWQPVPTWFERLRRAGVDVRAVLPAAFVGSGLTEAVYRGATVHTATSADDYTQLVADQLREAPARPPALIPSSPTGRTAVRRFPVMRTRPR